MRLTGSVLYWSFESTKSLMTPRLNSGINSKGSNPIIGWLKFSCSTNNPIFNPWTYRYNCHNAERTDKPMEWLTGKALGVTLFEQSNVVDDSLKITVEQSNRVDGSWEVTKDFRNWKRFYKPIFRSILTWCPPFSVDIDMTLQDPAWWVFFQPDETSLV